MFWLIILDSWVYFLAYCKLQIWESFSAAKGPAIFFCRWTRLLGVSVCLSLNIWSIDWRTLPWLVGIRKRSWTALADSKQFLTVYSKVFLCKWSEGRCKRSNKWGDILLRSALHQFYTYKRGDLPCTLFSKIDFEVLAAAGMMLYNPFQNCSRLLFKIGHS